MPGDALIDRTATTDDCDKTTEPGSWVGHASATATAPTTRADAATAHQSRSFVEWLWWAACELT